MRKRVQLVWLMAFILGGALLFIQRSGDVRRRADARMATSGVQGELKPGTTLTMNAGNGASAPAVATSGAAPRRETLPLAADAHGASGSAHLKVAAAALPHSREVPADFLDRMVKAGGHEAEFALADGRRARIPGSCTS